MSDIAHEMSDSSRKNTEIRVESNWGEVPTIKTIIGAFLVIISTLIIFRREIYNKKIISLKTVND